MRRYLLSAALLLSGLFNATSLSAETWVQSGMGGGGGLEIPSISPHNGDQIYMSSDMSGMYRSDDFGRSWNMLPFRLPNQPGLTDMGRSSPVQFTRDPNVIYANHRDAFPPQIRGMGSNQIRYTVKSTDGGKTFQRLKSPDVKVSKQVFADLMSTKRILVNTETQVLYSNDGGDSFIDTGIGQTKQVLLVAGVFWNGVEIVVATNGGIYRSVSKDINKVRFEKMSFRGLRGAISSFASARGKDGTTRFFAVTYPDSLGWQLDYPRNQQYQPRTITSKARVYRIDWKGKPRWEEMAGVNIREMTPFWVATSRNDPDTVYLAGMDRNPWPRVGVLKNTDGGRGAWKPVFLTDDCQGSSCTNGVPRKVNLNIATGWMGSDGKYGRANGEPEELDWGWTPSAEGFAVDPLDSSRLVLTTNNAHTSEDGGKSWRQIYSDQQKITPAGKNTPRHGSKTTFRSNGLEPTLTWWLTWSGKKLVAGMTDIYGMQSDDEGRSWRSLAHTLPHSNTYRIAKNPSDGTLYAVNSPINDIYMSHERLTGFESRSADISSCMANSRKGSVGALSESRDNGGSWQVRRWFSCPVVWVETDAGNPDRVYLSLLHSKHGGVFVTENINAKKPRFYRLGENPEGTDGNPYNLHMLPNGDLLTSWSIKQTRGGSMARSGIYLWSSKNQRWVSFDQPKVMQLWTRDIVIDPNKPSVWYAASFNALNRFATDSERDNVGGIYRFTGNGKDYQRITPPEIHRAESIAINPRDPSEAYVTTAHSGLWYTRNLQTRSPRFERVAGFPYRHPLRAFFSPAGEVWVTSFGGGIWRKQK